MLAKIVRAFSTSRLKSLLSVSAFSFSYQQRKYDHPRMHKRPYTEEDVTKSDNFTKVKDLPTDFESYNLSAETKETLRKNGINSLFPIQTACYGPIFEGRDLIGRDRTGSGKTIAFTLPILEKMRKFQLFEQKPAQLPLMLVLVPTRELAIQITQELVKLKNHPNEFSILTLFGGRSMPQQIFGLRRGVEIIVGTPGRTLDLLNRNILDLSEVKVIVLDETDEMLNMGFQSDIETIFGSMQNAKKKRGYSEREVQFLLFSATVPKWAQSIAHNFMSEGSVYVDLIGDEKIQTSKTVEHIAVPVKSTEHKYQLVNDLIKHYKNPEGKAIVFTNRKDEASMIAEQARDHFTAEPLHGDVSQIRREQIVMKFKNDNLSTLVATNVAARGLDFPNIDVILLKDLPNEPDVYIHRSGRAGRAGKTGLCITMFQSFEEEALKNIERVAKIKFKLVDPPKREALAQKHLEYKDYHQKLSEGNKIRKRSEKSDEGLEEIFDDEAEIKSIYSASSRKDTYKEFLREKMPTIQPNQNPYRLFVRGFNQATTDDDVKHLLEGFRLKDFQIRGFTHQSATNQKSYVINFESKDMAKTALFQLHGFVFNGKYLKVAYKNRARSSPQNQENKFHPSNENINAPESDTAAQIKTN